MTAWVGDPMGRAWQHVQAYPGCSKRQTADAVAGAGGRTYGYRVVDRAIALGLIESVRRDDGAYCLVATPIAHLRVGAARALLAWYTRRGAPAPAALVDRLEQPAGRTA